MHSLSKINFPHRYFSTKIIFSTKKFEIASPALFHGESFKGMCGGKIAVETTTTKNSTLGSRNSLNRLLCTGKLSQSPAVSRFESRSTVDKARRVHPAARSERQERSGHTRGRSGKRVTDDEAESRNSVPMASHSHVSSSLREREPIVWAACSRVPHLSVLRNSGVDTATRFRREIIKMRERKRNRKFN